MGKDMPSSSSTRPTPPAAPVAPQGSSAVFIDWGPALPDSYGRPRILALVRDPRVFFATWEDGDLLRARDLTDGSVVEHPVGRTGSWYFPGIPEHESEVELVSAGRTVATSQRIRLPRLHPAAEADPEWMPSEEQAELLQQFLGTLGPWVHEIEVPGTSKAWRRRVAGQPVSRPSRTS
jgi:hypothetical protein